jgi:hypothetical protein
VFRCEYQIQEQREVRYVAIIKPLLAYAALTDWIFKLMCVYCAVRAESLYIIQANIRF